MTIKSLIDIGQYSNQTRDILRRHFIDSEPAYKLAIEYGLTPSRVSRILSAFRERHDIIKTYQKRSSGVAS